MTVAANNIQKELVDVNNLWKWPSEYAPYQYSNPISRVIPVFWKWKQRVAYNGYLDYPGISPACGTFTSDAMMTHNSGGYSLGCFIDMQEGTYKFSCDSSPLESVVYFIEYQLMPDNMYVWSKVQKTARFSGHCEAEFQVSSKDIILLLKLGPYANTGQYTTFTNINIH